MSHNLYEASNQWKNRPDDQRFESLESMYTATKGYAESSVTSVLPLGDLRVEADNGDIKLLGRSSEPAKLTHHSFGQLARYSGAPPSYLRELPATLAAQCINHGIKDRTADGGNKVNLLFHKNGSLVTRSINSDNYDRVWNHEIIAAINRNLSNEGWVVPPARPARLGQKGTRKATAADILPNQGDFGLAIKVGDDIAPAGLYASDHDMFAFLVNFADPVFDGTKYMNRGVFIQNSEVGDCALKFKVFTLDNVCSNHICWGVGQVTDVSIRHVKGDNVVRGKTLHNAMMKWRILSNNLPNAGQIEASIKKAQMHEIAATKEDVLDAVFKFAKVKGLPLLGRKTLEAAYTIAERTPRYGSPNSVWGMINGLTEFSQVSPYTDERTDLDVQAGRLMEIAF